MPKDSATEMTPTLCMVSSARDRSFSLGDEPSGFAIVNSLARGLWGVDREKNRVDGRKGRKGGKKHRADGWGSSRVGWGRVGYGGVGGKGGSTGVYSYRLLFFGCVRILGVVQDR